MPKAESPSTLAAAQTSETRRLMWTMVGHDARHRIVVGPRTFAWRSASGGAQAPWHFLYFLPEPHQHGSLRPILSRSDFTTVAGFSLDAPLPPAGAGAPTGPAVSGAIPGAGDPPAAIAACEASAIAEGCSGPPPA